MDKERKKELRAAYDQRKPEMGVVCWRSGQRRWIAVSKDTRADYNGTLFQLQLGSWPGRELQRAYTEDPDSFEWSVLKKLEYKERDEDHTDDLELLYLECLDEYPDAMQMRPGKRRG